MGDVVKVRFRSHAPASTSTAKSSAVTRLSVTNLNATAKSLDNQTLPRRKRETVVRSHETPAALMREAIASSSSPSIAMNSDNCMVDNVHTMHRNVNGICASSALEPSRAVVHNVHMSGRAEKHKSEQVHSPRRARTYLFEYRKAAKLSQEKAVERGVHTSRSTLSRIENGEVPYSQDVLEAAARVYGTSVWHLLYCPPNTPLPKALEIWTKSLE